MSSVITLLLFLIIVLVVIFTIYFLTRNESKEPVKVDPAPVKVDPPVKTSTGAIAGGIGGAVVLCLILLAVFFYSRRKNVSTSPDTSATDAYYWDTNDIPYNWNMTIPPFIPPREVSLNSS